MEKKKKKGRRRRRRRRKKKKPNLRCGIMTISMDTCFGLYGATLDIRISCLAFDLSRVC